MKVENQCDKILKLKWKKAAGVCQSENSGRVFQITKSGNAWELVEVVKDKQRYLTNANSLAHAKRIATDYNAGKVYFDDNCIPRRSVVDEVC
jgi:hypothetical protein